MSPFIIWGKTVESKFKVGQMVRVIKEVNDASASSLSENFVAIGDTGIIKGFCVCTYGFNVDVQLHNQKSSLYFKKRGIGGN